LLGGWRIAALEDVWCRESSLNIASGFAIRRDANLRLCFVRATSFDSLRSMLRPRLP
jgi:hypothetical protein